MANSKAMRDAKIAKNDEFYTDITDIEKEMKYYKDYFKGKTVFCNCDDPEWSNFWKYFELNFNHLGLKKLISTHFDYEKPTYKLELIGDTNGDGKIDGYDIVKTSLKQNGDFRSPECVELLKEADIVVSNPPFSLLKEYVSLLVQYDKKFIIIGSISSVLTREIFELFKNNKAWLGASIHSGDRKFFVPDDYPLEAAGCGIDENGKRFIRVKGVRWYTNLEYPQRHEEYIFTRKYSPDEYYHYDNFDGIHIEKSNEIPMDYYGYMGVPVSFLDVCNPEQFEICGLGSGDAAKELGVTKNHRGRSDLAYTVNGVHKCPFTRVIIRRKQS